jgi:rare lipoprotein A
MSFPSPQESNPLELSWKIANGLRTAFGEPLVPQSFLKLADQIAQDNRKPSGWISGQASWYGPRFHGRKTSDGSRFDQEGMTAAHRSLPFGTKLLVMNRKTGNSCVVKVNDRGPFVGDRVIDLSRGAARQLNMLSSGVAMVDCVVLGSGAASGD